MPNVLGEDLHYSIMRFMPYRVVIEMKNQRDRDPEW